MPTTRRTRAAAFDSAPAIQAALRNRDRLHSPPYGCQLQGRAEHEFWRGLMSCKPFPDWTPPDLASAFKAVQLESQIRHCSERLADMMVKGADPCEPNSHVTKYAENLEKLRKAQLYLLRSLGLTHQPKRTATSANAGKLERETRDLQDRTSTDPALRMIAI